MRVETGRADGVLERGLQARGTLDRARDITHPEPWRRVRLLIEIGVIFIATPLLMRLAIFGWRIPLPMLLQGILLGVLLYMLWDPTFRLLSELSSGFSRDTLVSILGTFAVVGGIITLFVMMQMPGRFMDLPNGHPRLWAMVMVFYPLVSVIPQELIYRTFFFHRYGPLFGSSRWLAIVVNGVLFGFAHILFGSYVSMALTALLGFLVAWRYDRTRSLWAAWLEHSLYGCLIFSVGLGHYFFTGIASVR